MHVPDPIRAVRAAAAHVRPGGIVAFQEFTTSATRVHPPLPKTQAALGRISETFELLGADSHAGDNLRPIFLSAGLPEPELRAESLIGGAVESPVFDMITGVTQTLRPAMERLGLARPGEIDPEAWAQSCAWRSKTRRESSRLPRWSERGRGQRALAAGYQPAKDCVAGRDGGMGVHYANAKLISDPRIDKRRPEILVYEPRGDRPRLVAVEYFRADADRRLDTDGDRPHLFGRGFDGPMEGHEPGMPVHYDLHAWIFKHNPAGVFAQYNPRVTCP